MKTNKWILLLAAAVLLICLAACGSEKAESTTTPNAAAAQENSTESGTAEHSEDAASEPEASNETEIQAEETMHLFIGDTEVLVAWEDNETVSALIDLVKAGPLVIDMSMYGGFEQVGSIGISLPKNDKQTTTEAGDIVLYSGDQIVVFYGSNSWAYTRLGRITDKSAEEMAALLGSGNVVLKITYGGS